MIIKCVHCDVEFNVPPSKSHRKFCSRNCRFAKPEYHPMFEKEHTSESKVKMSNSQWLKKLKSDGDEIPDSIIKGLSEGWGWHKGKTKEDCEQLAIKAQHLSEIYKGKPKPEHSQRMKDYYKRFPEKHPNRILANRGKRTSIEQLMYNGLIKNNILFTEQHRVLNYYADFAIVPMKIIIECDGEYWHDKTKDLIRDEKTHNLGWITLRFKESQINKDIDDCIRIIKKHIELRKRHLIS